MFKREDYLEKLCSHEQYYEQFVTPTVLDLVGRLIGVDTIRYSVEDGFTDIPRDKWYRVGQAIMKDVRIVKLLVTAGDPLAGSDAAGVLIAKAAARMIRLGSEAHVS